VEHQVGLAAAVAVVVVVVGQEGKGPLHPWGEMKLIMERRRGSDGERRKKERLLPYWYVQF